MPSPTTTILALALAVGVPPDGGAPSAAPDASAGRAQGPATVTPTADRYALAQTLAADVLAATPDRIARVRERLALGVPPEVLAAVLGAIRAAPSAAHRPLLEDLSDYRAPEVRAHALALLARIDPAAAASAAARARFDADPRVARLGRMLAARLGTGGDGETEEADLVVDVDVVAASEDPGPRGEPEPVDLVVPLDDAPDPVAVAAADPPPRAIP